MILMPQSIKYIMCLGVKEEDELELEWMKVCEKMNFR